MKSNQLVTCDSCPKQDIFKNMKRLPKSWRCIDCYRKKKLEHREFLKRDVLHIRRRSDLLKEWEEKRKQREEWFRKNPQIPKIKGSINRSHSYNLHLYLMKDERQFLWRKYINMGWNPIDADEQINKDVKFLEDLVERLREEKKTNEDISRTFKEEFAKLLMRENGNQ